MSDYQEGQTASAKDGRQVVFHDGEWHLKPGTATSPNRTVGKGEATEEAKQVKDARQVAESAEATKAIYRNVGGAINRFGTSPGKASMFNAMTPDAPGFLGGIKNIGSAILGATVGRTYKDSDFEDYQYLQSQKNERVAERQIAQKGPQTEADAARYALSDIGADKSKAVNNRIIKEGNIKLTMAQRRPAMMSKWRAKYGSLGNTSPNGWTYDEYEAFWRKNFRAAVSGRPTAEDPGRPRGNTRPTTKTQAAPQGWSGFQEVK